MKQLITFSFGLFIVATTHAQTTIKPVDNKATPTKTTPTKAVVAPAKTTTKGSTTPTTKTNTPAEKTMQQPVEWEYKTYTKNFAGEVLHYEPAGGTCGTVAYASICIVKLEEGEIIRVLSLCNSKDNLKKGDEVIVSPQSIPTTTVSASSAYDTYDHIGLTTYGNITKFE